MKWLEEKLKNNNYITTKDFYDHFGFRNVVGVGHSGLKALAGPIYVVAVILPVNHTIDKLDKAKTISGNELTRVSDNIWEQALHIRVGIISNLDINNRGKKDSIQLGLIESLLSFSKYNPASCIIIDTLEMYPRSQLEGIPVVSYPSLYNRIEVISAATIVAKKAHSNFMRDIHSIHPEYGWDTNGGYATSEHINAINKYGWSLFHRIPLKNQKVNK